MMLKIDNLSAETAGKPIVDGAMLTIDCGGIRATIGPNKAGRSTRARRARLASRLAIALGSGMASAANAAGVPVTLPLLPLVVTYAACENQAFDGGSGDPVAACAASRTDFRKRARTVLLDNGYGGDLLQEMRRFDAALNMADRNSRQRVIDRAKQNSNVVH